MVFRILLILALAVLTSAKRLPLKNGHVYRPIKLATFGTIDATIAFNLKVGLTLQDKQRILDMHNVLRAKCASGQELKGWNGDDTNPGPKKMPTAANMQAVEWDDRLAKYAQDWANTCKDGHSTLNSNSIPGYNKFNLGENLSGDITFLEKDMYGEVRWWNYDTFNCQKGKQCGHYLNFNGWGMSRVGCGWKVCPQTGITKLTLVCIYAGIANTAIEQGATRKPMEHEYLKGPPCSACEQGWDFCMAGALCATKKQCDSDSKNDCKCLNDKATCEGNGGTFDATECSCKCPADKMGINCAKACQNSISDNCGMTCGTSNMEAFFCEKTCGSCGKAKGTAYEFWHSKHPVVNKDNLVVRTDFENPDEEAAKMPMSSLKDYGKCKNKAKDLTCNKLYKRKYCKNNSYGDSIRFYCPLSCSACDEMKAKKAKKDKEAEEASIGDTGWRDAVKTDLKGKKDVSKSLIDELKGLDGLEGLDLKGFKIV